MWNHRSVDLVLKNVTASIQNQFSICTYICSSEVLKLPKDKSEQNKSNKSPPWIQGPKAFFTAAKVVCGKNLLKKRFHFISSSLQELKM
jgi:hypothetical protein